MGEMMMITGGSPEGVKIVLTKRRKIFKIFKKYLQKFP
jgi:hypothetical protein